MKTKVISLRSQKVSQKNRQKLLLESNPHFIVFLLSQAAFMFFVS